MTAPLIKDLTEKVCGEITYGDLVMYGASLLNAITATRLGRWEHPTGLLDYVVADGDPWALLVMDFVSWCSPNSDDERPERLIQFLTDEGWMERQTQKLSAAS